MMQLCRWIISAAVMAFVGTAVREYLRTGQVPFLTAF